jgi:hypothetical protein
MTDGFDQALVNGGLALLQADNLLTVYPDGVPDPNPTQAAPPYVVVYGHVEWPAGAAGDALDGISGSPTVRWICHCVGGGDGATPADAGIAARSVAQRVRTALLNKRLVIAGLNLGLIRQESGAGVPQRDEAAGFPVMSIVASYRTFATT